MTNEQREVLRNRIKMVTADIAWQQEKVNWHQSQLAKAKAELDALIEAIGEDEPEPAST
jgi:hypothetical protein